MVFVFKMRMYTKQTCVNGSRGKPVALSLGHIIKLALQRRFFFSQLRFLFVFFWSKKYISLKVTDTSEMRMPEPDDTAHCSPYFKNTS